MDGSESTIFAVCMTRVGGSLKVFFLARLTFCWSLVEDLVSKFIGEDTAVLIDISVGLVSSAAPSLRYTKEEAKKPKELTNVTFLGP